MPLICNEVVLVNELLFYVRNKIHSTPKDAIIESCAKFYTSEEVSGAITLLESSLEICMPKRNKTEKSDPMNKMLIDIYEKLFSLDAASATIPAFVASDLSRIPRVRDNSDSIATTEQLLASIHDLKHRINSLELSVVTKKFLEDSLSSTRRSLTPLPPAVPPLSSSLGPPPPPPPPTIRPASPSAPSLSQLTPIEAASPSSSSNCLLGRSSLATPSSTASLQPSASAPPLLPICEATAADGRRWADVQSSRRPRRNTNNSSARSNGAKRGGNAPIIIGKKVIAGVVSWKGADLTVARYVGRVAVGASPEEIRLFLQEKEVEVVELMPLTTRHSRFLSFKLVVKKQHLPIIEDAELWSEGVIVGRFWSAKSSTASASVQETIAAENGS